MKRSTYNQEKLLKISKLCKIYENALKGDKAAQEKILSAITPYEDSSLQKGSDSYDNLSNRLYFSESEFDSITITTSHYEEARLREIFKKIKAK